MRMLFSFLICLSLLPNAGFAAFPDDWGRRQTITIQDTKIDADLTDFTVLVTRGMLDNAVVDPSDSNASQADGGDIRFSSDQPGTNRLPIDVIRWEHDSATGADDAEILVAVKVPAIRAIGNTVIYIWYDTASSDSQPADSNAFGSDNAYHDDAYLFCPDGGPADRTASDLVGTLNGTAPPTEGAAAGPVAGVNSTDYPGTDEFCGFSNPAGMPTASPITLVAWCRPHNASRGEGIVDIANDSSTQDNMMANKRLSDVYSAHARDGVFEHAEAGVVSANTWTHVAARFTSSISRTCAVNGVAGTTGTVDITP